MYNAPLYRRLMDFAKTRPARFFMPGHKGGKGIEDCFLTPVMPYDVTELSATGNLYRQEGIIEEAHDLCAAAFGAKWARFCTGGSTQGIHAGLFLRQEGAPGL
jgi:arginine/lysine/ornithine decarboxylase